ncbi:unnamed protein product [Cunninghamella echinulata]
MGAFDLAKTFFFNKPAKPYNEELPGEGKVETTDESQQIDSFNFDMLDQEYNNLKNKFYNFKETLMEAYKQKCSEIDNIKNKLKNVISSYSTEIPVYNSSSPIEIINNYIDHLNSIIKNYAERNSEYDNKLTAVIEDKENSELELKSQIEKLKEENENLVRKNKEEKELSERLRQWMYNKEALLFELKIDYRDLVKSFTECENEQIRLVNEKHDIYIEKMETLKKLEIERKKVEDKEANEKLLTEELAIVTSKYNQLYSLQLEEEKNKENKEAIDVLLPSPDTSIVESPNAPDLVNDSPSTDSKTIQEQCVSTEINENIESFSNGAQQQENNKYTSASNSRKRNFHLSFNANNEKKEKCIHYSIIKVNEKVF